MAGKGGPWWGLTLSLSQGSLLKVVLEDYLRLKKLFAQRMVQKASSCHSSISEVAGRPGAVCCAPALGMLTPSLLPSLPLSLQPSLSLPNHPSLSQSLWRLAARAKDSNGWGPGSQVAAPGPLYFLGSAGG